MQEIKRIYFYCKQDVKLPYKKEGKYVSIHAIDESEQMIDYISGFENKLVVAFTTVDTVGTRNTIKLAQKYNISVVEQIPTEK